MKPFFVAAGIASGKYDDRSIIDTSPGFYKVGMTMVEDEHNLGPVNLATVLAKSSNVGDGANGFEPRAATDLEHAEWVRLRAGDHERLSR